VGVEGVEGLVGSRVGFGGGLLHTITRRVPLMLLVWLSMLLSLYLLLRYDMVIDVTTMNNAAAERKQVGSAGGGEEGIVG